MSDYWAPSASDSELLEAFQGSQFVNSPRFSCGALPIFCFVFLPFSLDHSNLVPSMANRPRSQRMDSFLAGLSWKSNVNRVWKVDCAAERLRKTGQSTLSGLLSRTRNKLLWGFYDLA